VVLVVVVERGRFRVFGVCFLMRTAKALLLSLLLLLLLLLLFGMADVQ
jgi:hypothetical protein